jgi:hypothetical protein
MTTATAALIASIAATRRTQFFAIKGDRLMGETALTYYIDRDGKHVVCRETADPSDFSYRARRFDDIQEARNYWRSLRDVLVARHWVAV